MDAEHLDIQPGGGSHGFCDGVWDVVKFEVEENGSASAADLADDIWTCAGEELAADLECANQRRQLRDESQAAVGARNVEGDNDGVRHCGERLKED